MEGGTSIAMGHWEPHSHRAPRHSCNHGTLGISAMGHQDLHCQWGTDTPHPHPVAGDDTLGSQLLAEAAPGASKLSHISKKLHPLHRGLCLP